MSAEVAEYMPVLREFVDAVNERDPDVMQACFAFTPPGTLAVLCAGWVGELLDEIDEASIEVATLTAQLAAFPAGDVLSAWRVQKERTDAAEQQLQDSREENAALRGKLAELMKERRAA